MTSQEKYIYQQLLFRPIKNKEELYNFVKVFLKVDLPDYTVCSESNSNPLDFVWKLYKTAVYYDKLAPEDRYIRTIAYATRGGLKCITGDSIVLTENGFSFMENLKEKDGISDINYSVYGEGRLRLADKFLFDGIKDTLKIKTVNGFEIEGTEVHPLKVLRNGEIIWSNLKDIKIGDYMVIEKNMNYFANKVDIKFERMEGKSFIRYGLPKILTKDLSYVIGLLLGGGCLSIKNRILFSCGDQKVLDKYVSIMNKLFGDVNIRETSNPYDFSIQSKELYWYFTEVLGMGCKKAPEKAIPNVILKSTKENQISFLKGLFDADSIISKEGKVILILSSKAIIRMCQSLLLNLGFSPEMREQYNEKYKRYYYCLKLSIHDSFNLLKIMDIDKNTYNPKNRVRDTFSWKDRLPLDSAIREKILENKQFIVDSGNYDYRKFPQLNFYATYKSMFKSKISLYNPIGSPNYDYFDNLLKYDYYEVKEITKSKNKVYDFHIPDGHLFWANGFISHNSMSLCIAEFLIMIHAGRNAVHVGLVESQAKTAYQNYFRPFLDLPYIKEHIKKTSILEKSVLNNRKGSSSNLIIIPCTMNKTSSPRANLLALDEVDKARGEQLAAYYNAFGMLTTTNDRKMPMVVAASTRDNAYGVIQDELDSAEEKGTKVLHWNLIDITEKCPDSRSGEIKIPIYVKNDSLIYYSEPKWKLLPVNEQLKYTKYEGYEGCISSCRIFSSCLSQLKNQKGKSKWLKTIDSTQQALTGASTEQMAIAQLLCRKPSNQGLVYSDVFSEEKSILTASQMYEVFTGKKPNEPIQYDELIDLFLEKDIKRYISVDAGFHFPRATLIFVDGNNNVYVMKEIVLSEIDSPDFASYLKQNWSRYEPNMIFVDPESPDMSSAIRKEKIGQVSERVDKKVQLGIATVKSFMKVPGTEITKFFVSKECKKTIWEITQRYSYMQMTDGSYTDTVEKKDDHLSDTVRYCLHTLFGQAIAKLWAGYVSGIKPSNNPLDPMKIAREKLGVNIIDNRHILEDKKQEKPLRNTSKFDFTKY